MTMRIGQGFDVHQLFAGRKLVIGGVEIAHGKGLLGHSDADVLLHAICDALLGAAGLGDIGQHFPDTDSKYHEIDSRELLRSCWAWKRLMIKRPIRCCFITESWLPSSMPTAKSPRLSSLVISARTLLEHERSTSG